MKILLSVVTVKIVLIATAQTVGQKIRPKNFFVVVIVIVYPLSHWDSLKE